VIGGEVIWYGKPYAPIYRHALALGGSPAVGEVLAIGDGLETDMLGAARMGFDAVFITGGIHAGEEFPADFTATPGLGVWRPLAVVDALR
jgi:ribonucleotide monophosphatase NagD (HAD superfamily)